MAEDEVNVRFGATTEQVESAIKHVTEQLEGLTSPISGIREAFSGFAEAFAAAFAVEKLVDWVKEVTEAGAQVEHLSQQLGMSAEQVSAFTFASGAMGLGTEQAALGLERLERNMAMAAGGTGPAAKAFDALGISVTGSNDQLKSLDQILPEIANKFAESADGPNKTAIAIALLGRSGAQLIPFLNEGAEGIEHFKRVSEETGSVITGPMAEGMEKTAIQTYTLGKAFDGIGLTLYEAFKPAIDSIINGMIDLAESFNRGMKETGLLQDVLTGVVVAFDLVIATITVASGVVQTLWQVFADAAEQIAAYCDAIGKVVYDAFSGNWSKIHGDWQAGLDKVHAAAKERGDKIVATAEDTVESVKKIFSNLTGANGVLHVDTSGGEESDQHKERKDKLDATGLGSTAKGKDDRLQQWQNQLDQMEIASNNFFKDNRADELAFWQDKLKATEDGTKLQLEVERKIYALRKQLATDQRADLLEHDKAAAAAADEEFRIKADAVTKLRAQGAISAQDELTQLRDLENQRYTVIQQELADELKLYEGDKTAQDKIRAEIEKANQIHLATLQKQNEQFTSQTEKTFQSFLNPFVTAFDTAIKGVIQGTQTLSQAINNMAQSILLSFVNMGIKMVEDWAVRQLAMLVIGDTTGTAEGLGQVGKNAAVAASAAYASTAAIPVIGPELAPAAATTAYGATLAWGALVGASAAGGYDIPSGVNPIVQAHQREMILPEHIADPLREMIANGGSAGGGDIHIHATDADSFRRMLLNEKSTLVQALRSAGRGFAFT